MKPEKVYAAVSFNEESNEWVNLVLTENGYMVMCLIYAADEEAKCRYEMVEVSKSRLNQRNQDNATKYKIPLGSFDINVVDKKDQRFVDARALHEKKEARQSSLFYRTIDKTIIKLHMIRGKFYLGLVYLLEKIEPYLDLH